MANYENGAYTRQAIVRACRRLFYEKGYHDTSYPDICKAAHVNRSTIYYHFHSKEAMRYEIMWEYTIGCKRIAEKYCDRPEYHYILATYILWHQVKHDPNMRRFQYQICLDYPVYTGKMDASYYYSLLTDRMWGAFFDRTQISELSYASVYGYIMCCMRMLCENPEQYDPLELFIHCADSSIAIWNISQNTINIPWQDIRHYISRIPAEAMAVSFAK